MNFKIGDILTDSPKYIRNRFRYEVINMNGSQLVLKIIKSKSKMLPVGEILDRENPVCYILASLPRVGHHLTTIFR